MDSNELTNEFIDKLKSEDIKGYKFVKLVNSFDEFNESELDGMLDDDVFVDSEIKPDKIDKLFTKFNRLEDFRRYWFRSCNY